MCKKIDELGVVAKQVGAYVYGDPDAPYYDFSEVQLRAFANALTTQHEAQRKQAVDERSAFEDWAKGFFAVPDFSKSKEGIYIQPHIRHAYKAWEAGAALSKSKVSR